MVYLTIVTSAELYKDITIYYEDNACSLKDTCNILLFSLKLFRLILNLWIHRWFSICLMMWPNFIQHTPILINVRRLQQRIMGVGTHSVPFSIIFLLERLSILELWDVKIRTLSHWRRSIRCRIHAFETLNFSISCLM